MAEVVNMPYSLEQNWYEIHDNILCLLRYLADTGATVEQIVYAVEKPWKYQDEFREAKLKEARENAEFFDRP